MGKFRTNIDTFIYTGAGHMIRIFSIYNADFIFQQDLAPAHSAKTTSTWFKDHGIPVLNWPANSPDLNPIENLWGIVKREMRFGIFLSCQL